MIDTLFPSSVVKSDGRSTVYGQADTKDEDGKPQKAGKRYPGKASGKVGTRPMHQDKRDRLRALWR